MSNISVHQSKSDKINVIVEQQTLLLHIMNDDLSCEIGVCVLEAAEVGKAVIKLLFIDAAYQYLSRQIFTDIQDIALKHGFNVRSHQRFKDGRFTTHEKVMREAVEGLCS